MFVPPPPEFSRLLAVETLRAEGGAEIAFAADAAERVALARRFAVPEVLELAVAARVSPFESGGWRVVGEVTARLRQTCVVTLEPIETVLKEPFERRFLPAAQIESGAVDIDVADEPPEPLGEAIDAGEIAAETAALAIDPYPRKPGAVFEGRRASPPGAAPLDDESARPFASLAALRLRPRRD